MNRRLTGKIYRKIDAGYSCIFLVSVQEIAGIPALRRNLLRERQILMQRFIVKAAHLCYNNNKVVRMARSCLGIAALRQAAALPWGKDKKILRVSGWKQRRR